VQGIHFTSAPGNRETLTPDAISRVTYNVAGVTGSSIDVGANSHFKLNGQPIVYSPGQNATVIGGLTPGQTYYVIPVPNTTRIQLSATRDSDGKAGAAMLLGTPDNYGNINIYGNQMFADPAPQALVIPLNATGSGFYSLVSPQFYVPQLATVDANGNLQLNVGKRSNLRNVANDQINESYQLTDMGGGKVLVEAFGRSEIDTGVTSVAADFGNGNDTLTLTKGFNIPVTAHAGDGNDIFTSDGPGAVAFYGGNGNDTLIGGTGPCTLEGGAGNNYMEAQGTGILNGPKNVLVGGGGNNVFFGTMAELTGATIQGGSGKNTLEIRGELLDYFRLSPVNGKLQVADVFGNPRMTVTNVQTVQLSGNDSDSFAIAGNLKTVGVHTVKLDLSKGNNTVNLTLASGPNTLNLQGGTAPSLTTNQQVPGGTLEIPPPHMVPTTTASSPEGETVVFSAVTAADQLNIKAQGGNNNFRISGNPTANLTGGDGPDQFTFTNGSVLTGSVNGGGGANTFTFMGTAKVTGIVDGGIDRTNQPDQPDLADFRQAAGSPNITVNYSKFPNIEQFLGANVSLGTTQPVSVAIDLGQSENLGVTAGGGTAPYSFQWYTGDSGDTSNPISGATGTSTIVTPTSTTNYWVQVTDAAGAHSNSNTATVAVNPALIITRQPASDTFEGARLQVNADGGTPGYTYQWYLGKSGDTSHPSPRANESQFGVPDGASSYWVRVTDSANGRLGASFVDSNTSTSKVNPPVRIATQPVSATIDFGQSDTLSVTAADGNGGYAYQWYGPSFFIQGAQGSSYTATPPARNLSTGSLSFNYYVTVTDEKFTQVRSDIATITVNPALSFLTQPASAGISYGGSGTLSVTVTGGTAPYFYQWYKGERGDTSSPIAGATTDSYTTDALTNTADYWVRVTDSATGSAGGGIADSNTAVMSVSLGISRQPASASIDFGQSAMLSVVASGGRAPYSYQWYRGQFNGGPISGATASTLDAGPFLGQNQFGNQNTQERFWVVVKDGKGFNVTSNFVTVTANAALRIDAQPASATITYRQPVTLSVSPSLGTVPYTYQWYQGSSGDTSSPIPSANSSSYNPTPAVTTNYWVRVTDSANGSAGPGIIDSGTATITVNLGIGIQPASATIDAGQTDRLIVLAGGGTPGYTYQWYIGNSGDTTNPISNAVGNRYTAMVSSPTSYWVKVTDAAGAQVNSNTANITVNPALRIVTQPQSGSFLNGETKLLAVSASDGTPGYSYQWYIGDSGDTSNAVSGATNAEYTTPPLTSTTRYWVQVSDSANGSADSYIINSNTATLAKANPALAISKQPASSTIKPGGSAALSVTATGGTSANTYQWYMGKSGDTSHPISGVTGSSYTTTPTTTTSYWVQVTDPLNEAGANVINSATATVTVVLTIAAQPASALIDLGQSDTLSVTVAGGTPAYSYRWYGKSAEDGREFLIDGATSSSFTSKPTTSTGYFVRVTDAIGAEVTSSTAWVTVNQFPLTIDTQPASAPVSLGQSYTLSVGFTGGILPWSYQWYIGNSGDTSHPISGATDRTYAATPTSTTNYWVRVSDAANGSAGPDFRDSTTATLTVALGFSTQPASANIDVGQSDTLSVTAGAGVAPFTYQWYNLVNEIGDTSQPIPGATSTSYTYTPKDAGGIAVWVQVTDATGAHGNSSVALVQVSRALEIYVQPQGGTIAAGQSTPLSVQVLDFVGTRPVSYQWYMGTSGDTSQRISGATASTYTAAPTATTNYWVRVSDAANGSAGPASVDSNAVTVTVTLGVVAQPAGGVNIDQGQSETLSATAAAGTGPYTYQWYSANKGTAISGATSSSYTTTNGDTYFVRVTDASGAKADSNKVKVQVVTATFFTGVRSSAQFGNTIDGSAQYGVQPYHYQWYFGASGDVRNPILGATGNRYTVGIATEPANAFIEVGQSATLNVAAVTSATSYWLQVTDSANGTGGPYLLNSNTITVSANPNAQNYTYQWYVGQVGDTSNPVFGLNNSSTYSPAPTSTTSYWCRVSNGLVTADSSAATVTVNLAITTQPATATISNGQSITLSVTANGGTTPYSYQWYTGTSGNKTQPISGATGSSYKATPSSRTSYWVLITDVAGGSISSDTATINVST